VERNGCLPSASHFGSASNAATSRCVRAASWRALRPSARRPIGPSQSRRVYLVENAKVAYITAVCRTFRVGDAGFEPATSAV
jgi:hypothetical protein